MIDIKYILTNIADNYRTFDGDHNRQIAEQSETKLLNDVLETIVKRYDILTKNEIVDLLQVFLDNKKFT